ncbi:MAG: sigma-70 family RNA polymerase sigma factor [Rhodospirillaceae bacterium]|nr:MAG: sigma-70 family RNA polymerase sigma factor [Rhodospirillaceae bacterium]
MVPPSRQQDFDAVVLPHLDAAFNLARWLMRNAHDAEDVVQEAIVRALTYYRGFRGENPRAWLLQIVRNTAYGVLNANRGPIGANKVGADQDGDDELAGLPDHGDGPDVQLMKKQDRGQVHRLLGGLPVDLRETLVLREFEDLSYKEIARITETPIGTVMSRLWRARRLLAEGLEREGHIHD